VGRLHARFGERTTHKYNRRNRRWRSCHSRRPAYEISKRPKDKNDERAWAQHDLLLIRLIDLNKFFGDKTVSKLRVQLCRDFGRFRAKWIPVRVKKTRQTKT
jgi:hypothetical protein